MEQQLIFNFLNLPGIVGFGLIDDYSRPYFSGIDKSLNAQQKDSLMQGVHQVISTTPLAFESFNFQFSGQDVWLYQLQNKAILLVVTNGQLEYRLYNETVARLKDTLEGESHDNMIATLRSLVGARSPMGAAETTGAISTTAPETIENPEVLEEPPPIEAASGEVSARTWEGYLAALNTLTDATAPYLGKIVVANTWRTTRPKDEQLDVIQLDRAGHFSLSPKAQTLAASSSVDETAAKVLHQWVSAFVKRCAIIIRDYEAMVIEQQLTAEQRAILQIG
ncbi:MAG: hypothetical protein AAGD09_15515 [Cyanobacteria bacterium P01_F01_bin.56]